MWLKLKGCSEICAMPNNSHDKTANRSYGSVPKVTEAEYWGGKLPHSPILIMHAHLINYAFYSLSLNTIHNSLGNWIYTSLIIPYCINKSGFFSRRLFRVAFPSLSLHFPLFLFPISSIVYPSSKALLSLFFLFFFTLPVGFELSILYPLRQTSSLSSIQLFYMCLLPIMGNFQNYISNTLFQFQKLTLKSFSSPLKHVVFCTKKWNVNRCLIEV